MANGTGIASLPRGLSEYAANYALLSEPGGLGTFFGYNPLAVPGLVEDRYGQLKDFLGPTDYASQLKESQDLAKMQLGLALAQRGFAAMGAQPEYGESSIGVLGRTLAAPLAADVFAVAGPLIKQRQGTRLAHQQEDRQLKLSALGQIQKEGAERRALAEKIGTQAGTKTQQAIERENKLSAYMHNIGKVQASTDGPGKPFRSHSALYFDPAAFQKNPNLVSGESFPFRLTDPNNPYDRNKDRKLTPEEEAFVYRKIVAESDTLLKGAGSGDANVQLKARTKLINAIENLLNASHDELGFTATATVSGVPGEPSRPPGTVDFGSLGGSGVNEVDLHQWTKVIPYPRTERQMRLPEHRVKVLATHFPFESTPGNYGEPGTDSFRPELVQARADLENALTYTPLRPSASRDDHRALLSTDAAKSRDKRDAISGKAKSEEEKAIEDILYMREEVLAFKNAALGSQWYEGFGGGLLARTAAITGMTEWLKSDEQKDRIARLTRASEQFASGFSRKLGRGFGDSRISNYDAEAYKNLVPNMTQGELYNRIKVDDMLDKTETDLLLLVGGAGDAQYSKEILQRLAESGIDFSKLKTLHNWHGHGYFGGNVFPYTRQKMPSLSKQQYDELAQNSALKATMLGEKITIPDIAFGKEDWRTSIETKVDYNPQTKEKVPKKDGKDTELLGDFTVGTQTHKVEGLAGFDAYIDALHEATQVPKEELRRRAVEGVMLYYEYRDRYEG